MVRNSVVLPHPLGPSSVNSSPFSTVRFTSSRAATPGNLFEMFSSLIDVMGSPASGGRARPGALPPKKKEACTRTPPGCALSEPQFLAQPVELLQVGLLVAGRHLEVVRDGLDLRQGRQPCRGN